MHKILQNHLLCAFVANLKIDTIYALYAESFCNKNLAIRKVLAFCDSVLTRGEKQQKIGSQSILGIYSRGRKAVREEVAEIESGHFSDLRRQQTVWIRSNWLIRAARIPR